MNKLFKLYFALVVAITISACLSCVNRKENDVKDIHLNGLYYFYQDNINGESAGPAAVGPYEMEYFAMLDDNSGPIYCMVDFPFYEESNLFFKVSDAELHIIQNGNVVISNIDEVGKDEQYTFSLSVNKVILNRSDGTMFVVSLDDDNARLEKFKTATVKRYSEIYSAAQELANELY